MELEEFSEKYPLALKRVNSERVRENFMVLELGYEHKIVLPHKDGVELLNVMGKAEKFDEPYSGITRISFFDRTKITASIMSAEEYQQIKIAALLNIPIKEFRELQSKTIE